MICLLGVKNELMVQPEERSMFTICTSALLHTVGCSVPAIQREIVY